MPIFLSEKAMQSCAARLFTMLWTVDFVRCSSSVIVFCVTSLSSAFGIPVSYAPQAYLTMGYCAGAYPEHHERHYSEIAWR
ncbi:MAG: hypothetical protein ACI361_02670 [Atopobiaceae bacterium]